MLLWFNTAAGNKDHAVTHSQLIIHAVITFLSSIFSSMLYSLR